MGRLAVRLWLLNKRLFKKCSFWMILCMVPVLVAGMRLVSREESGIASIAIYREDLQDDLAEEVVRRLTEEKTFLRYVFCEDQEEARALVVGGKVEAALIFPKDLHRAMEQAAADKSVEPVVTMVVREDSVILTFVREILSSVLYPYYSYEVYKDFVRDDCGLGELSDKELLESYNEIQLDKNIFRIILLDGTIWEDEGYLLAPIRGIQTQVNYGENGRPASGSLGGRLQGYTVTGELEYDAAQDRAKWTINFNGSDYVLCREIIWVGAQEAVLFAEYDNRGYGFFCEYDVNGHLIKETYSDSEDNVNIHEYEYDAAGNQVKDKYYDNVGYGYELTMAYDASGNLIEYTGTDSNGSTEYRSYKNIYDAMGNLISCTEHNGNGDTTDSYEKRYEYLYIGE